MDSSLLRQFNQVVNREKAKFNKRLAIFLFFLLISTILWFLIKLSHEYTTGIDYPIQLVNPPKGKVIAGEPPRTIQLKVKAYGYTLLRYKLIALMSPIQVSVKGAIWNRNSEASEYYVLMSDKFGSLASQLSDDIILLGTQPDTLFFNLSNVIDKVVPVKPDISITYSTQHMLAGAIKVKPSSITITGPSTILDTITQVKTKQISLGLLSEVTRTIVPLSSIPQVTFSENEVKVEIPVEKFTETTLEVPLVPQNVPDNAQVKLLPDKVNVKCNVVVGKYFLLKANQFKLVCNFNDPESISDGKIRVSLERYPDYVGRVDFQPKYVDFILKTR